MKAYELTLTEITVPNTEVALAKAVNIFDVHGEPILLFFNDEETDIPNCFIFDDATEPDDVLNEILATLYY